MKLFNQVTFFIWALISFHITSDYNSSSKICDAHFNNDSLLTIRIAVVGDLMCHSPQFNYARVNKDSFDFNPVYRLIKPYLEQTDFCFGNLETVIGEKRDIYKGYPRFKSPPEYISALANNGFDFLCFANNHTLDQGENGVINTIELLEQNNLGYTGSFKSKSDRDSIRVINIKGLKLAILAYSYGTNGSDIPKGKSYLINLIDFDLIQRDIVKARENGAEIILINFHFGNEYQRFPSEYQTEVVNKSIEFGADIITASHPHVIQPIEFFKTNNSILDTGVVTYSLGNFISNQRKRYTDAGVIVYLNLEKNLNSNQIKISSVEYIPTWVFKGKTEIGKEFIIVPLNENKNYDELTFLSESDKLKMSQAIIDTKNILNQRTTKIKIYEK